MQVLGAGWGYGVLAADMAKGRWRARSAAVWRDRGGANLAGTAAVVGHCLPVWNGFRGGKGVAASAGQCLATFPAYFPIDLGVAWATGTRRLRRRAYAATVIGSISWVGPGGVVAPGLAEPLGPAANRRPPARLGRRTSAVILGKFMAAARQGGARR